MSSPTGTSREEPRPATAESLPLTSANADTVGTVESLRRMLYIFIQPVVLQLRLLTTELQSNMAYLVAVVLITAPLSFGLFKLRLAKLRLISASVSPVCKRKGKESTDLS